MKTLLTVLVVLGMAGMAWGDGQPRWWLGGHTPEQGAVISLTGLGAVVAARKVVDLIPLKDPGHKAALRGFAGLASGYVLLRIADRMQGQTDRNTLYHGAKDGACITGGITFSFGLYDTWKLLRAEKKK